MKVLLLFVLSFCFCEGNNEKKEIPKLDLRDGVKFNLDLKSDLIVRDKTDGFGVLSEAHIEKIKVKAKAYLSTPYTLDELVIIETSYGKMTIKLYPDIAPNHCNNFKKLANSGFYDGTLLHKVIPGNYIQGGDILTRDGLKENDGTGNPGWTINQEFNNLKHKRGILSMHRISSDENSAGSQFFICLNELKKLDGKYTAFGEIIDGYNVINAIERIPSESNLAYRKLKDVIPDTEDKEKWSKISYNSKEYFIKIPEEQNKENFINLMKNRLDNLYGPSVPVRIKSIRVAKEKIK